MKTEKVNYVLEALSKERLDALTKDALVKAFNDDGIFDLEGIAENMLKRIKNDSEIQQTEPRLIDFAPLGKRTSKDLARSITHAAPEVPFVLDGIAYEPEDIRRFDGQALVFIPTVAADGSTYLQLFDEKIGEVIASYFQMRQIASLLNPADFLPPWVPPQTPPGTPPGTYTPPNDPGPYGCGGITGIPCGKPTPTPTPPPPPARPEPPAPFTLDQIQMFDSGDYTGNWFWLAKGYMWKDLTRVSRGGFFGGDWNDKIFSLSSTNTSCIYCEHINLEGSKFFLGPNKPIRNLAALGWHNRISSVWNFDS